jgi:hypothetical protein
MIRRNILTPPSGLKRKTKKERNQQKRERESRY